MTGKAGIAYMFNGRIYHAAVNNESEHARRVLIYNYGHL
jgi:ectoine hydroxylase-related dioxygenase (phytanoyl-CoA dioxygenase family)